MRLKKRGDYLRRWRHQRGYSQAEVAAHCGVSRSAVAHWERGFAMDLEHAIDLSNLYGIDIMEMMRGGNDEQQI